MFFWKKKKAAKKVVSGNEENPPENQKFTATIIRFVARKSYSSMTEMVRDTAREFLEKLQNSGGEVSMKKIQETGSTLEVIDIHTTDLDEFRRKLADYQVEFAIVKDSETGEHEVVYKCKDMTCVQEALEKALVVFQDARPSLDERLAWAKKKVEEQDQQSRGYNRYK